MGLHGGAYLLRCRRNKMGEGEGKRSTLRGAETVISRKAVGQFSGNLITFLLHLSFILVF